MLHALLPVVAVAIAALLMAVFAHAVSVLVAAVLCATKAVGCLLAVLLLGFGIHWFVVGRGGGSR